MEVEERNVSYKELFKNSCTETFCTGTAAVITPIRSVSIENKKRVWNEAGDPGVITKRLYDLLAGIQYADIEDEFGWVVRVK
jgi:branched-chain amino acid aminotransferase